MGIKGDTKKLSGELYVMTMLFPDTVIRVTHPHKGEMTKIGKWFHKSNTPRPLQNFSLPVDREYHSFSLKNIESYEKEALSIARGRFETVSCQSKECFYMTLEQGIELLREAIQTVNERTKK